MGLHCGDEDFCHHPLKNGFDYYYGMPLTNTIECGEWSLLFGTLQSEIAPVPMSFLMLLFAWFGGVAVFRFANVPGKNNLTIVIFMGLLPLPPLWYSSASVSMSFFFTWLAVFAAFIKFVRTLRTFGAHFVFFCLLLLPGFWYSFQVARYYTIRRYNCVVMRNYEVVQQPARLGRLTVDEVRETQEFIARNSDRNEVKGESAKPFLAYVSFHKAHTALATAPQFVGKSVHGSYGDVIMEMDWAVGQILDTLTQLNLTENTVVMFTSDHGPSLYMFDQTTGEYQGGWAGIYRGGKGYNYEGGIRVPMMIRYPLKLPRGAVIDRPTSHLDVFPTLLSIAGIGYGNDNKKNNNNDGEDQTTKTVATLDGQDIYDLLTGVRMSVQPKDRILFHYCGIHLHAVTIEEQAINTTWKVHLQVPKAISGSCSGDSVLNLGHVKPAIYNLTRYPREDVPLSRIDEDYERVRQLAVTKSMKFDRTVDFGVPGQLVPDRNAFSWLYRVPFCKASLSYFYSYC